MNTPFSNDVFLAQIDRILHSDTLHSSEVLRRLLKFLSGKSVSGEADQLKEYTIAVEALDRPSTYDPQHDSVVRIQMGRLRQKLAEYYRTEGKDDVTIIDLPKGRFKLSCVSRLPISGAAIVPSPKGKTSVFELVGAANWVWFCILLVSVSLAYSMSRTNAANLPTSEHGMDKSISELWHPFLAANRPLIIAFEDPLFVRLPGTQLIVRDLSINDWDASSSAVAEMQRAFKGSGAEATHYYSPFGQVNAAFLLGRSLGMMRQNNLSLIRTSELSWQQLANNDVVFIGKEDRYEADLQGMPVRPQLTLSPRGVQDLRPKPGQPGEYLDNLGRPYGENGEAYALISRLAGPLRTTNVEAFTSRSSFAYMEAVQWFSDPKTAGNLLTKLRKPDGSIPEYYQVLLKVQFKDQVPTETTFVVSRELQ
jgi:hypothetical protein